MQENLWINGAKLVNRSVETREFKAKVQYIVNVEFGPTESRHVHTHSYTDGTITGANPLVRSNLGVQRPAQGRFDVKPEGSPGSETSGLAITGLPELQPLPLKNTESQPSVGSS